MKISIVNKNRNEYRFDLTNKEACERIFQCISPTNPGLKVSDIKRSNYAREFVAKYKRDDGENVHIAIEGYNLKRYFGAFILCFTNDGIWFYRQMKKNMVLSNKNT